jgi:hypothetical protein
VVIVIESEEEGYWKKEFKERPYDTDSREDILWIH